MKLLKAATEDDRKKMIADAGFDFTKEELTHVMKTLSDEKLRSVPDESRPGWFYGSVGCQY